MFISQCEDKSMNLTANKFKYNSGLEKNKLFVSNLPFETTKEQLEEVFKPFGALKEVRIVTFKSGKSKGLAYVEFQEEGCAAKAILQTDNMLIGDHQISVAISNPPKKNARNSEDIQDPTSNPITSSLGSGNVKAGYVKCFDQVKNLQIIKKNLTFIRQSQYDQNSWSHGCIHAEISGNKTYGKQGTGCGVESLGKHKTGRQRQNSQQTDVQRGISVCFAQKKLKATV
jgi:RNA recognition motif-containing protein